MKYKYIVGFIVILGIVGSYFYPHSKSVTQLVTGAIGDTNSTQRIAQVVMDLTTTTPTSTGGACKLNNTDTTDRIVTGIDFYLNALTSASTSVASTTWKVGTSTDIYTVSAVASNLLSTTIATSTGANLFVSSSTPGVTGITNINNNNSSFARVWATGTCLNVLSNSVFPSTVTGIFKVSYIVSQ